jgi:hypothetical protein
MKIKSLLVAVCLLVAMTPLKSAVAAEKPIIESLTFSPTEIELFGSNRQVKFELIASHPDGIENSGVYVTLTNSYGSTLSVYLERQPATSSSIKTAFAGTLNIPTNISSGAYLPSISGVRNVNKQKYQFESDAYTPPDIRKLVGAEKSLLIRSNGNLDLNISTFIGPTYDPPNDISFTNTSKYNRTVVPIWRVGETFDPKSYFELKIQNIPLLVKSNSPEFCKSDGELLSLVAEGTCNFSVHTEKNQNYMETNFTESVAVMSARIKPVLVVPVIGTQTFSVIKKNLELTRVYDSKGDFVVPLSQTPLVCLASVMSVKIIAGGTCTLTYQTAATYTHLASDLYKVTFDISEDGKPIVVPTATPTPTAAPVVKKTISCVKGKKTVTRTGTNSKCPKGYKVKK